jgi:putative spermidine/putrescine transport system permease protein
VSSAAIEAAAAARPFVAPTGALARVLRRGGAVVAWCGYLFLLLPSLIVIPVSFGGGNELQFPPRSFSLALYAKFFSDASWWGAAVQSLKVGIATTVLALAIAVPAAYALARSEFRGKALLSVTMLSPMLVPVVVLGLGQYMHLAAMRIVGSTLGIVLAHAVVVVPFVFLTVGSGLRHTDPVLERVATLMGAGRVRIFFEVVLPQIRTSLAVGALFAFLISFDEVVIAYFVSGPQTTTLPVKMYSAIRWEVSPVLAAVSTLLTAISLAVSLGIMALQRRGPESADGERRI